ncbi:META domain-containing protein [Paracoccus sp. M683]|uniref:META domain-containing protein n=1 Tax=Paracoccus sp. M683 TaxID=2594268 RepID=UPI001180FADC|nr:META domain-containing protein [Paracoccus sp. M683]TRW95957.1 META domain-containing protein [Paracoccus sp. M683]
MAGLKQLGAAVIGLTILAGCDGPAAPAGEVPPLGDYQLISMGDEDVERFHVTLMLADGQISGAGFCNRYSGTQTAALPGLQVGPLAVTRRACIGDLMARDQAYFDALAAAGTVGFADGRLMITGEGPTLTFEPHIAQADHPAGN